MVESNKAAGVLESVVTAAILFVIIQTFLEDVVVIVGPAESFSRLLLFTGVFFDLFFTVEFLIRLYNALIRRRVAYYIIHERGWIDFLASVPLLMLSSGPPVLAYFLAGVSFGGMGGILNMLKLIKAIRIARILRLLRIIKIFRSIKYADSPMAQRHVAKIITTSVAAVVFSLFFYSMLSDLVQAGPNAGFQAREEKILSLLKDSEGGFDQIVHGIDLVDDSVVLLKRDGKTLYARYNQADFDAAFTNQDYSYRSDGGFEVYFDKRTENRLIERSEAWQTLFFFCVVMLIVVAYLVIYSPHFAITVTDPIHVMKRGFGEKDYNLEVKIHPVYPNDDIYELARLYNQEYLPLKDRNKETEDTTITELKLDDIKDLFE